MNKHRSSRVQPSPARLLHWLPPLTAISARLTLLSRHALLTTTLLGLAGLPGLTLCAPTNSPPRAAPSPRTFGTLHTNGARLEDAAGHTVRLTGLNWFGLETCAFAPHGLASRNWRDMMTQISTLGFNAIRLPFSSQLFDPGSQPNGIDFNLNPDLQGLSGLQILDKIVAEARALGLKVILDRQRPDCGAQSALWYTDRYSEDRWISDWVMLAKRYAGNDAVIGADLHNEPHGPATWGSGTIATDWRLAAERAGNAILRANPNWLIFVEGIEAVSKHNAYWWGGNLANAGRYPVRLIVPHRLVYEAHDYGPSVWVQSWFHDPTFPRNLPSLWDQHWGYLQEQAIAPVFMGEFGARNVDSGIEGTWIHALMSYLKARGIGYTFWCLNPDSGDTGGLLEGDWKTVDPAKMAFLRPNLAPLIGTGAPISPAPQTPSSHHDTASPTSPVPASVAAGPVVRGGLSVLYASGTPERFSSNPSPHLRIVNTGDTPVALSDLEARYYFTAGGLRGQTQILDVDWSSIGANNVRGAFIRVRGDTYYLQLRFAASADPLAPHGGTAEVRMRIHKPDWSPYDQADAYSFGPVVTYTPWPRVALLAHGQLVWGTELR